MSDLISRQAAIDAIRASTSKYTGFMELEMYTDDDAVEAIKGLPSAQQWIPCSENRFPDEENDVLVCNADGDIEICCGWKSTEIEGWDWAISGWRFGKVIAWMPLPAPYVERRDERKG